MEHSLNFLHGVTVCRVWVAALTAEEKSLVSPSPVRAEHSW